MKDRAQTPEQKRAVIEAVYAAWCASPDLRLGQLLMNALWNVSSVPFYVEDFALVRLLAEWRP